MAASDAVPGEYRARPRPAMAAGTVVLRRVAIGVSVIVVGLTLAVVAAGPLLRVVFGLTGIGVDARSDFEPLAERSVIEAADGSVIAELHGEIDREVVSLEEIPAHVREAVLIAEDRRFHEHDGYDPMGIARALWANARSGEIEQGGSTITQQLAKRNFVGDEPTVRRKLREVAHAVALEERFTKDELLERYLNEVYFGAGAYGVAAAAEEFFRADVGELTVDQAALLAAVIRSPARLDPREDPEGVRSRRDLVLAAMAEEGRLGEREAEELAAAPVDVAGPLVRGTDEPYVVEAVKRAFLADPAFGDSPEERADLLFNGGLRIQTTIDPRLQSLARDAIDDAFDGEGPTGALVAVDPRDGAIRAMHAGADFSETQFDVATQGRRQPGSAFKPFVLAAALEAGVPLDVLLDGDSPTSFQGVPGWQDEDGGVRNFGDADHGTVDLREALVRSVNTAFAELMMLVGPERVADLAGRTGIDADRALGDDPGPAVALGGLRHGVTPLEMASAYGVLAAAGEYAAPHVIAEVATRDGEVLLSADAETAERVRPAAAAAAIEVMQDVVRRGTGTAAQLPGWEPAGKTGTTQNSADAWFVGAVPVLSTAVWMGHPEAQVAMPGATGGGVPASLWAEFMEPALDGVDPVAFPETDETLADLQGRTQVPDVRGMDEDEARRTLLEALLVADPVTVADGAAEGTVVWQDPQPDRDADAGAQVRIGVSSGQAPEPDPPPEPEPDPPPEPEPDPEEEPTDTPGEAEDDGGDDVGDDGGEDGDGNENDGDNGDGNEGDGDNGDDSGNGDDGNGDGDAGNGQPEDGGDDGDDEDAEADGDDEA